MNTTDPSHLSSDAPGRRLLFLGDYHLKPDELDYAWVAIEKYAPDAVIMMGDYVDDWDATLHSYRSSLEALGTFVDSLGPDRIRLLWGNHDIRYLPCPTRLTGFGYLAAAREDIVSFTQKYAHLFRVAVRAYDSSGKQWLFTHAGLTGAWSTANLGADPADFADTLNALAATDEGRAVLQSVGPGRGGSEVPSPLWADIHELLRDPCAGLNQVVGHTPIKTCAKYRTTTDDIILACDTWSTEPGDYPIGDRSFLLLDLDTGEQLVLNKQ